jgi:hypothetical protein
VNNELERLWKDVIVTGFDTLSWHLSGTAQESQDSNWAKRLLSQQRKDAMIPDQVAVQSL